MVKGILGFKPASFQKPRKRDMQRAVNPFQKIREPIKASTKKQLYARAKNKCEGKNCNEREILHIHHLNGNVEDNRLVNLKLFCANCHGRWHNANKHIRERDSLTKKVLKIKTISKEKAKELKRKKPKRKYPALPKVSMPKFRF